MLTWFDRIREAQILRCEKSYPRMVRSLRDVDDLYLDSMPGVDTFLRRDGSVWEVLSAGSARGEALVWRQATAESRVATLAFAALHIPEVAELLPARPEDAVECPSCTGRDVVLGLRACHQCLGLGWIPAPAP